MRFFRSKQLVLAAIVFLPCAHAGESDFVAIIDGFVREHCYQCHSQKVHVADLRLDTLGRDLKAPAAAIAWQNVVDRVKQGSMPPLPQPRPNPGKLAAFVAAIETELQRNADPGNEDRIEIRRLSHSALDNTVHDLLGTRLNLSEGLPADTEVSGFDNLARTLGQSKAFLSILQRNARALANDVIVSGPDPRVTRSYTALELGRGSKVSQQGGMLVLWSSKNRQTVAWPRDFAAPRTGVYRIRFSASQKDNRAELAKAGKTFEPTAKSGLRQPGLRNKALAAERPRMAAVMAAPTAEVRNDGGASTGGRKVGEMQLDAAMATYTVECLIEKGENIFLTAVDTPRMQIAPMAIVDGKEMLVGDLMFLKGLSIEGPLMDAWPPAMSKVLLDAGKLPEFLSRAFRGPVDTAVVTRYRQLFDSGVASGLTREASMRNVVEAVLCSPLFLYTHDAGRGADAWALASRLSYFLWNSPPDEELRRLAASGELLRPETIGRQARRMLADPRVDRFVKDFPGQWLGLRRVGAMLPDPDLYPDYDRVLERSMRQEGEELFREILTHNRPIREFLNPGYAMLNERLARHYGIKGVEGREFRKVALPPESPRGGLLGQASMLTITSNGTRTSPVVRGVWVLENLLDAPPPPPPGDVKPLEPDVRGAKTIREMMARHSEIATCRSCHGSIDPWGFGLEHFDATGAWRDHYGGNAVRNAGKLVTVESKPIDSSGVFSDGRKYDGAVDLRNALLARQGQFSGALASKLLAHALGHPATRTERIAIDALVKRNQAAGGGFADLVAALCTDKIFLPAPTEQSKRN
jgi:hypothetical protein